jgi:hypothetical protein
LVVSDICASAGTASSENAAAMTMGFTAVILSEM